MYSSATFSLPFCKTNKDYVIYWPTFVVVSICPNNFRPRRLVRRTTLPGTLAGSVSPAIGVSSSGSIVGGAGQQLTPSLEEVTDVRSGVLGQEEEGQTIPPGTETSEHSEPSEQSIDPLPLKENAQMRLGRPATIEVGERAIETVETKGGETVKQQHKDAQQQEPELALLPQCYSSPTADPSQGSWKKVDGGVGMSPTTGKHIGRCVGALRRTSLLAGTRVPLQS